MHAGMRNTHKMLVGKPERKRAFRRARRRWEGDIKLDFRDIV
jgi:hypothetical protein